MFGDLVIGDIRINARNPRRAYVSRGDGKRDILIDGYRERNRALNGDTVAIQLDLESKADNEGAGEPGPRQDPRQDAPLATGKVVCIIKSVPGRVVSGYMQPMKGDRVLATDRVAQFVPMDRRVPKSVVARKEWPTAFIAEHAEIAAEHKRKALGGDAAAAPGSDDTPAADDTRTIYVGKLKPWGNNQYSPFVKIIKSVGMTGSIAAETEALLCEAQVDYDFDGKFPEDVLACLKPYVEDPTADTRESKWTIPDEELKGRLDLRAKRVVTIDPTTARDLDDALSIDQLDDHTFRIGVHIADVTYFVRPGTALDREAAKRCTTIYLVQKSIPMLPRVLSENLCSLAPKVDRLAHSCFFTMNDKGQLLSNPPPWFGKTVVRTICQLDYQTAQKLVDADPAEIKDSREFYDSLDMAERMIPVEGVSLRDVASDLRLFNKIARARRADRFATGSLGLNRGTVLFHLDEKNNPTDYFAYKSRGSNKLIEEYMLLANALVAGKILSTMPNEAIIRAHPPPKKRPLSQFTEMMAEMGYNIDASSAGSLQKSLVALDGKTVGKYSVRQLTEILLTRPMCLAEYAAAGIGDLAEAAEAKENESKENKQRKSIRHYALNFDQYTHFTSPIRRFVDVVSHRQLSYSIRKAPNPSFTTKGCPSHRGYISEPAAPLELPYDRKSVKSIADKCNTRNANSKQAQMTSQKVFLSLCLKMRPGIEEAVVMDMGYKSFKVAVPRLGLEQQVFVDDIKAKYAKVTNQAGQELTKDNEADTKKSERYLRIVWPDDSVTKAGIFDAVTIKLTSKTGPPLDVAATVVQRSASEGSQPGDAKNDGTGAAGDDDSDAIPAPGKLKRRTSLDPDEIND